MALSPLNAPIPGMSLTSKPKNRPWENPPELNTVAETLMFYTKHLSKPDVVDDLMVMLEVGFPVIPLVETIRTSGVMQGKHTLDVGLLIEPALVKFITATAESLDVPYEMGGKNTDADKSQNEKDKISMLLTAALSRTDKTAEEDEGVALMEEISDSLASSGEGQVEELPVEMEAEPTMEELPAMPEGAGLMARGQ
tara:strand:+ start:218 stop:805 length:588 start_codon:yes stop_codon:yes gene_type:complete